MQLVHHSTTFANRRLIFDDSLGENGLEDATLDVGGYFVNGRAKAYDFRQRELMGPNKPLLFPEAELSRPLRACSGDDPVSCKTPSVPVLPVFSVLTRRPRCCCNNTLTVTTAPTAEAG
jgi:hypothetical protein